MTSPPPRAPAWRTLRPSAWLPPLLERVLPPDDVEDALGDLDEDFNERKLPRRGRLRAELWYVAEAVLLVAAVLAHRWTNQGRNGGRNPRRSDMGGWSRDLRHALRSVTRRTGTSAVIILTIALGVGAATAMFSVVDATYLRPLPYPDAERLVRVFTGYDNQLDGTNAIAPPSWRDVLDQPDVMRDIGVWSVAESVHLVGDGEPQRLWAPRVSASLFGVLGMEPALGRTFTDGEEVPGQDDVVVLSHGLWTRAFGADPSVLEETVQLDDRSYRVIGVAPVGFDVPEGTDVWRALALGPDWFTDEYRGWELLGAVGHLAAGIEAPEAARRLSATFAERAPSRATRFGQNHAVVPLREHMLGSTGPALLMLLAAVGLLLLIACANVTSVLLARSEARTREFALRRALGSGAVPLTRLVMLETLLLAMAGGAVGIGLAMMLVRWVGTLDVAGLASFGPPPVDRGVLAFALATSGATALVFGLGPVMRALHADPQSSLKEGHGRAHGTRSGRRVRSALVVAQVAVALILMVAVGTSLQGFYRLTSQDPGFRSENVLTATLELPATGYDPLERVELYRTLLERARGVPGVTSVGLVNGLPLAGTVWSASFDFADPDPAQANMEPGANMRAVSPDYFGTLGLEILEGRGFTEADGPGAPDGPVAVVDRTVAERFWPGRSPVGDRIELGALSSQVPATIVGVVSNVLDQGLHAPNSGHVYFPVFQRALRRMVLVARVDGDDPLVRAGALRAVVGEVEPRMPVFDVKTMEAHVRSTVSAPRLGLMLLAAFGGAAVLLAAVGIYGVLAYSVERRTAEIGTRVALGADPSAVTGMVVREALVLWGTGTVLGIAGAMVSARLAAGLVVGLEPARPFLYGAVVLSLGAVALVAALLPAARAARVDPVEALRAE